MKPRVNRHATSLRANVSRRTLVGLGGAAALGALSRNLLPTPVRAQQKIVFKASDVHPEGYPTVAAVENLGKKLETATNGRLSVQMYAAMQLGGEKEAIEQAQIGAIQMARVSVGTLGPVINDLNVINLPFLFRNTAHMEKIIDDDIGAELLDKVTGDPKAGLVALCWMDAGARNLYDTKKPIRTIADLKGLKIRVIGNPMFVDMMNALGGNGVAMGYDQVFSALQTGVVDGAENNLPSYVFDNHYTVAKYYTPHRAPDRAGDARVLAQSLGHAVERRSGSLAQVRPRSATRRARSVEQVRKCGARQGQGRRQSDHPDRRQDAVPGRGQAGLGQIRAEIRRNDQAHPGGPVTAMTPLYRRLMDALYLGCVGRRRHRFGTDLRRDAVGGLHPLCPQ